VCRRARQARRTSRRPPAGGKGADSAPVSGRQIRALLRAVWRELTWGLPSVSREIARWRKRAEKIPSTVLREDALDALKRKRGQSEGAALFSILPRKRSRHYLRLLVAYQVIWDYLDSVSERGASAGIVNGFQLHLALIDALDPGGPIRDYYRHSPWREDAGYLRALVQSCRECCEQLPSYQGVRARVLQDAERAQVLAINHVLNPEERDAALQAWARREFPNGHEASWYELSGAASAGLATFALLALACEPVCSDDEIARAHAAYFPWVSAVACMLDSYADRVEDAATGDHSYIAHYPTSQHGIAGAASLVRRALGSLRTLNNCEMHVLILCSMVALYLSKDSVRTGSARGSTRRIAIAGGSLTRVLIPILRLWRASHSLNHEQKETRMPQTVTRSTMARRRKRELPPSPLHPAIMQTLAGHMSPYAYVEYCRAICGERFTLYPLNMPPTVFFAGAKDIHTILTGDARQLHPGAAGAIVEPVVGEHSFMLLEEDEHLHGRKAITPAFHRQMVEKQAALVSEVAARAVATWPLGTAVALDGPLRALTLEVIVRTIFSDQDKELVTLQAQLMPMLAVTHRLILQAPALLRYLPGWRASWRQFLQHRAAVDKIVYRLIRERRESGRVGPPQDVLDMLLRAQNPNGSPMTRQQIRDGLMSVILAGYETTTGQVSWAFQLLAHNPSVLLRLTEELDDGGGEEFLAATVYETLRHKPVFLIASPRQVAEPFYVGDRTYRPPVRLAACTYLLHHDPSLYPAPHTFRPERFLGSGAQSRDWLPWGGGRKHCPGRHFAMLEVTTILRHVLLTRTVLPASEHIERPRWRSAILVPSAGGRVVLLARVGQARNFF
jgi:tetraprenyl-beta-curcumene synthase